MSGNPIGSIESTSISPSSIRYRAPTLTRGLIHIRTLQVISPRRIPSRSRLVNVMKRVYVQRCTAPSLQNDALPTNVAKREQHPATSASGIVEDSQENSLTVPQVPIVTFREAGRDIAFAGYASCNGHAIRTFRPERRIVPKAIVPLGPRETRHLGALGVARGRRDYLHSDDLLLFARGVGHNLPKLLNGGVLAACLQKNRNSGNLPIAGFRIQAPSNLLHTATTHSK